MYQEGLLAGPSAVAQLDGCAIYLTRESDHPYLWTIPADAALEERDGVTFVHCERCTLALWPINLRILGIDEVLTDGVRHRVNDDGERIPRWPDSSILRGDRISDGFYGFAVEIADTPDEAARSRFVEAAARLRPETTGLTDGVAAMTPVSGRGIQVQWAELPIDVRIWRDGTLRDWTAPAENVVFGRPPDGTAGSEDPVITLPWQGDGTLTVRAGGRTFACTVSREGRVTFRHD